MNGDGAGKRASFEVGHTEELQNIDADRSASRAEQGAADEDQFASDADHTATDADQSASDADQSAAERDDADALSDQQTAAEDQARADRQLPANTAGAALEAYEATRARREATKIHRPPHLGRNLTTDRRGGTAADRDATAAARDETARRRNARAQAIAPPTRCLRKRWSEFEPAPRRTALARQPTAPGPPPTGPMPPANARASRPS